MFISSIIQPVLLDMSQRVMPLILSAEAAVEEPGLIAPEQMAGYTVTVLFTVINIIAAYLILKRFVFKPITKDSEWFDVLLTHNKKMRGKYNGK